MPPERFVKLGPERSRILILIEWPWVRVPPGSPHPTAGTPLLPAAVGGSPQKDTVPTHVKVAKSD